MKELITKTVSINHKVSVMNVLESKGHGEIKVKITW